MYRAQENPHRSRSRLGQPELFKCSTFLEGLIISRVISFKTLTNASRKAVITTAA